MTDNTNKGYKEVIDTLTGLDVKITEQKFHTAFGYGRRDR
jgi:hypothetical protein